MGFTIYSVVTMFLLTLSMVFDSHFGYVLAILMLFGGIVMSVKKK